MGGEWPVLKSEKVTKESSDRNFLNLWRNRTSLIFRGLKRLFPSCATVSKFALDFKLLGNLSKLCLLSCLNNKLIKLKDTLIMMEALVVSLSHCITQLWHSVCLDHCFDHQRTVSIVVDGDGLGDCA